MRIVLDTNVLVSAFISEGTPPDRLYLAWKSKQIDLITSEWQLNELSRVLSRSKLQRYLTTIKVAQLMTDMRAFAQLTNDLPCVFLSPGCDDNYHFAFAFGG